MVSCRELRYHNYCIQLHIAASNEQVGGYRIVYKEMTYATVRGAGHMVSVTSMCLSSQQVDILFLCRYLVHSHCMP